MVVREGMEKSTGGGEGDREVLEWWWSKIREWSFWRSFDSEAVRDGGEVAVAVVERRLRIDEDRRMGVLGRRRNAMTRV